LHQLLKLNFYIFVENITIPIFDAQIIKFIEGNYYWRDGRFPAFCGVKVARPAFAGNEALN